MKGKRKKVSGLDIGQNQPEYLFSFFEQSDKNHVSRPLFISPCRVAEVSRRTEDGFVNLNSCGMSIPIRQGS